MAKLLMPSLVSDRLGQLRTPLGLNRSKTPNSNYNYHQKKSQDLKKLNKLGDLSVASQKNVSNTSKHEIRMKEVSSMKDLDSSSVILNDNPLEQTLRTFDDSCKNADLIKREGNFHSSFVQYNSRQ